MFKFYSYKIGFELLEKYIIGQCRLNFSLKCVAFKWKKCKGECKQEESENTGSFSVVGSTILYIVKL